MQRYAESIAHHKCIYWNKIRGYCSLQDMKISPIHYFILLWHTRKWAHLRRETHDFRTFVRDVSRILKWCNRPDIRNSKTLIKYATYIHWSKKQWESISSAVETLKTEKKLVSKPTVQSNLNSFSFNNIGNMLSMLNLTNNIWPNDVYSMLNIESH